MISCINYSRFLNDKINNRDIKLVFNNLLWKSLYSFNFKIFIFENFKHYFEKYDSYNQVCNVKVNKANELSIHTV